MKVLLVEPGKHPRTVEIEHTLEAMYRVLECETITANRTAASYNEYYLKNSFVWSGAVPSDIRGSLPYL